MLTESDVSGYLCLVSDLKIKNFQLFTAEFGLGGSDGKESDCNAGDLSSTPESGILAGVGNIKPLQYSCLENSIDRGAWRGTAHGVAKSQTWLSG